jgi:hypothetical protein
MTDELLPALEQWFQRNCDGDWEHSHGVSITTLDNPGWQLQVDVRDLPLERKPFAPIEVESDESNWYHCRVTDGIFKGAGGPRNLSDLIKTFESWAKDAA